MFLMISFYIIISIFNQIVPISDSLIIELEKDQKTQIQFDGKLSQIIYIVSKNDISGTYTYDFISPYILELTLGRSDAVNSIPTTFEKYHYEKGKIINGYYYSMSVSVKDDNKYTFIKVIYKDDINNFNINNDITTVNLVPNYTWNIIWIVLFMTIFDVSCILFFCSCGRSFLEKACNFMDLIQFKKKYKKLEQIYELNVISIE